jgi:hypothetical protein
MATPTHERGLARVKLARRALPPCRATPVSAGSGPEARCALCDGCIEDRELRYTALEGLSREPTIMNFHVACFLAWEHVSLSDRPAI